ncbi:MAG: hypothetical protein ISP40_03710 [Alphaproteobacteria bacterium]|nr:hypothetical protein [Alphaproteobacteria bacterium]
MTDYESLILLSICLVGLPLLFLFYKIWTVLTAINQNLINFKNRYVLTNNFEVDNNRWEIIEKNLEDIQSNTFNLNKS